MQELGDLLDLRMPDAGFYFWIKVPALFDGNNRRASSAAAYEHAHIYALADVIFLVKWGISSEEYVRIALVL